MYTTQQPKSGFKIMGFTMWGRDGIYNNMNMNFDIKGRSEQHIQFSDVARGGATVLMT